MIYQLFKPSAAVQEFVKMYHLLHFELKGSGVDPTKSYFPHAEQCLTFDPRGRVTATNRQTGVRERRSPSYLSSQQIATYDLNFDEDYLMLKVIFKPGALYRLLGVPLLEFGNSYVDASSVMGRETEIVNEQLANAAGYDQMIEIVERFLLFKIKNVRIPKEPVDKVYDHISSFGLVHPLDWIASEACLSSRQLERKYQERIGVSPVTYNRILRFNEAVRIKEQEASATWLGVAIQCGYSDLQHLIKDFKRFWGSTPSRLIQEEANTIHRRLKLG